MGSSEEGQPPQLPSVAVAVLVAPEALLLAEVDSVRGVLPLDPFAVLAGHKGFPPEVKTPCHQEHQDPYPQMHDPMTPSVDDPSAGVLEPRSGA